MPAPNLNCVKLIIIIHLWNLMLVSEEEHLCQQMWQVLCFTVVLDWSCNDIYVLWRRWRLTIAWETDSEAFERLNGCCKKKTEREGSNWIVSRKRYWNLLSEKSSRMRSLAEETGRAACCLCLLLLSCLFLPLLLRQSFPVCMSWWTVLRMDLTQYPSILDPLF